MKKSINAWSVSGKTDFPEMFAQIKAAGFDGIELNVDAEEHSAHSLTLHTEQTVLEEIKRLSEAYALPVVSISTSLYGGGVKLGSRDLREREFGKTILRKQLECARALGADGILIVPGGIGDEVSLQTAYTNSFETLNELKSEIEQSKVHVGVENVWNGFFLSPFDMCRFIDDLNCAYIGAYYDVGNVIAFSWSEYWIEILGKRIRKIHVKDFKRNRSINSGGEFVDLLKGDVNWKKVIPALRGACFDGYLTAEVFKTQEGQSDTDFYREVSAQLGRIITEF